MQIALSAHIDLARPVMSIKLDDKNLFGLVDNLAGVFVAYQASRKTGISVHFTNFEELDYDGADAVAKSLDKDSLIIVIDTILEKDISGKAASITNAYGLDREWNKIKEKFKTNIHFIDGFFDKTEDETWIYGKRHKLKTFYFGVPIPGTYYHDTGLTVSVETIDKAANVLVNMIEWLKKK